MVTATPVTLCIQNDSIPGFLFFTRSSKPSFSFWNFGILYLNYMIFCYKPNENIYSSTKQDKPGKPKCLSEKIVCPFTQIKIYHYAPKPIETVKNNQGKQAYMESYPSW
mgnify:CR=1 FL=1